MHCGDLGCSVLGKVKREAKAGGKQWIEETVLGVGRVEVKERWLHDGVLIKL